MNNFKETCPTCDSKWSVVDDQGHTCLVCQTEWTHDCMHCHDDPPKGHICPACKKVAG